MDQEFVCTWPVVFLKILECIPPNTQLSKLELVPMQVFKCFDKVMAYILMEWTSVKHMMVCL
jgi:hypothetical protein